MEKAKNKTQSWVLDHFHNKLESQFEKLIQEFLLKLDPLYKKDDKLLKELQAIRHNEILVEGNTNTGKTTLINLILGSQDFLNISSVRETSNFYRIKRSMEDDYFFSLVGSGGIIIKKTRIKDFPELKEKILSLSPNFLPPDTQAIQRKEEILEGQAEPQDSLVHEYWIDIPKLQTHLKAEIYYDIVDIPGIEEIHSYDMLRKYIKTNCHSIVPILVIPLSQATVEQKHLDDIIEMCNKSLGGSIVIFTKLMSYQNEVRNELQRKLSDEQQKERQVYFGQTLQWKPVPEDQVFQQMEIYIQSQISKIKKKLAICSFIFFEFDQNCMIYANEQGKISLKKGQLINDYLISDARTIILDKINQNIKTQDKQKLINAANILKDLATNSLVQKQQDIKGSEMFKKEKLSFIKQEIEKGNLDIEATLKKSEDFFKERNEQLQQLNEKQLNLAKKASIKFKETQKFVEDNVKRCLQKECNKFNESYGLALDKKKYNHNLSLHVSSILSNILLYNFTKKIEVIERDLQNAIYNSQRENQKKFGTFTSILMDDIIVHDGGILAGGGLTAAATFVLKKIAQNGYTKAIIAASVDVAGTATFRAAATATAGAAAATVGGTVVGVSTPFILGAASVISVIVTVGYLTYSLMWSKETQIEELLNKVCKETIPKYFKKSEEEFNKSVKEFLNNALNTNRRIMLPISKQDDAIVVSRVMRSQGLDYEDVCSQLKQIEILLNEFVTEVRKFA